MRCAVIHISFLVFLSVARFAAQTGCVNTNFESTPAGSYTNATAVSGWTVSSQTVTSCNSSTVWTPGSPEFSILTTPFSHPVIGSIFQSPLGGNRIAQLNNNLSNNLSTKLTTTIAVTSSVALFTFAYAGVWQNSNHTCCEQPSFKVHFRDNMGNLLSCPNFSLAGVGCNYVPTYTVQGGLVWTNWQVQYVDLTPFIGTTISIEVICSDCTYGDHYGTVYFDAACPEPIVGPCYCSYPQLPVESISFCAGTNLAVIEGPPGYTNYQWNAPVGFPISPEQSTLSALSITNALAGNIYTLTQVFPPRCIAKTLYTLSATQVSITGIGSGSSCAGGASGSATVVAKGSSIGYNYSWVNSTNSVVSTSSVVNNLPVGVYTVTVAAPGCGTAIATTTVGIEPPNLKLLYQTYCPQQAAYLSINNGSSIQWYNGSTATPASQGGTSASYTLSAPVNNSFLTVSYITPQGCHDSLKYMLYQVPPGTITIPTASIQPICLGASNGTAMVQLTPATGASGPYWFSVNTSGTNTAYSSSLSSTQHSFIPTGLSAGNFSVQAFDGSCFYTNTFVVSEVVFNYSLMPQTPTICTGQAIPAAVTFTTGILPNSYTFSWSPTTWLFMNNGGLQNTLISPSVAAGSMSTVVYTVIVTPGIANCPLTKTMSVTMADPSPPVITPVPALCQNAKTGYSIQVSPAGGIFTNPPGATNVIGTNSGILTPSVAPAGVYTFTYAADVHSCMAKSSATYTILSIPDLNITGNTNLCAGNTTTLTTTGANSYTWSNQQAGSSLVLTPLVSGTYTVTGQVLNTCVNTKTISVIVTPMPTLALNLNTLVCIPDNNTITLSASGADSYSWSTGNTGPVVVVNPTVLTSYSVAGINYPGECKDTAITHVFVFTTPTVTISGNTQLCAGESTTLIASGAAGYDWNGSPATATLTVKPPFSSVYQVAGVDSSGNCRTYKNVTVLVDKCLSLSGQEANALFSVYPNPFQGDIHLSLPVNAEIRLLNCLGEIVYVEKCQAGKHTIPNPALPAGMYLIEIRHGGKTEVVKVVRN